MLSTVPILFWHELMQRGIQLNFFLFKVIPVSFNTSSSQFVSQSVLEGGANTTTSIVLTTLVTYLIVGVIEEISKYWVLRHSSERFFHSIDDTMQLAIIVAIGFAFAENLANPTYFVGFVQNYLLKPETPQWAAFIAGVFGRGVLTMMVHILSTGVLGYFLGVAFFASQSLREKQPNIFIRMIGELLSFRQDTVFAQLHTIVGVVAAIVVHGIFDFIVSLPEVLPGRPGTVGALLGSPASSPLHNLSIVLVPSLLYVVGGFWLLVTLFQRKEDMKVYGTLVPTTSVITQA
jgi:RsiW-degrading membrane proteinase PrsW (M82 family)